MREKIIFNNEWLFSKQANSLDNAKNAQFEKITLPHTWNNLDGQDGGGDYYKGTCGYKKSLNITNEDLTKELYLEFEAIMSISDIYINDKLVKHHEGGFQTIRIHLNEFIHEGENTILVLADNSANQIVYPQFADFTFYGGIYRDVYLIKVPKIHFDLDYFGTEGIQITPKLVDGKWLVEVFAYITNSEDTEVTFEILSKTGKVLDTKKGTGKEVKVTFEIKNPHLWNGRKDPYLYTLNAYIGEDSNLDRVEKRFGLRTFRVDPEKGFYLNDKPYHLHGVSRHQDRLDMGWAITRKEHKEDMELIKEVGATTIRLAHYQHAQYFYDLCDEEGMIVWAEIPYISAHMDTGKPNVFSQMNELILQNYNHPSIVCWGLSNEITMKGETETLINDHKELNDFVHYMDPTRLTTIAEVSMVKMTSEMCKISDIISYNHYFGWYAGTVEQNGPWLDKFHEMHPTIPLGLSEYGCEAILDWHSEEPKQGDYTEEYQAFYHEEMLKTFATRPFLWSTHVWNMFDFAADNRDEGGKKGRNHKGLVTYDRKTKKDSFYIYKAYWNDEEKFVHICSKRYEERSLETIKVKVYTNLDSVTLFVNDAEIGTQKATDHKVIFDVNLVKGENKIVAKSGEFEDSCTFTKVDEENPKYHLANETEDVINWFDKDGNEISFNFPEGYLNIDSPIKEINATPLGKSIMSLVTKFGMKKMGMGGDGDNSDLLEMMGTMSIRRIAKLAGGNTITKEYLYAINKLLNKIPSKFEDTNRVEKSVEVKFKDKKYILNGYEGYYSINSKVKALLKSKFVQEVMKSAMIFIPDLKKNLKGFKYFVFKQCKVITLMKLVNSISESLIKDINNILINIKID